MITIASQRLLAKIGHKRSQDKQQQTAAGVPSPCSQLPKLVKISEPKSRTVVCVTLLGVTDQTRGVHTIFS